MSTRVLLTGASGYMSVYFSLPRSSRTNPPSSGGTLLKHLLASPLAASITLFALVRTPAQSEQVKLLGSVTPLTGDHTNPDGLRALVVENQSESRASDTSASGRREGRGLIPQH